MKIKTLTAIGLATVLGATALPVMAASGEGGKGERAAKMFETLDTDGSGTITQAEFEAKAAERFAEVDANGDGLLSPEEMAEASPRKGKFREGGREGVSDDRRAEFAARMVERKDTNGDGLLSVEEIAAREDVFARLDTNGDGALSLEEFEAMRGKHKRR
ncbi:hypothetical protein ACMU_11570 [Actibacterium mucosum KCTC 23349]|uniref:EF-hand domain-containing protein n=1 Tax=Actibacterium mucosum KCTC 23349 TaxID=1454373 RepID=A0A037ZIF1_9RHOB|nr:EF-hand domain-containing protein [Actibacterium mucosum]KAJ55327.1 hypothetical protein ACMU_11570 [Actibacterium mucosum KCTC 23349]